MKEYNQYNLMRADDIRKDQMRNKEIEPNGISPNSTALGHD